MLNRRILRIKAFKVIYGYAVRGGIGLNDALFELDKSCEATRDLYLYMLTIIPYLTHEAQARIDAARNKFNPTAEELNPNEKFAKNALSSIIENDPDIQKLISRKKLTWEPYDILVRKVLDSIQSSEYYAEYMANPETSLKEDCGLFKSIFESEFEDNEDLHAILEDQSIYWVDDLGYALIWDCKTLDSLAKGRAWRLPELYQSDEMRRTRPDAVLESDNAFVHKLVTAAFTSYESTFNKVIEAVPDWDKDRLFSADMAVIALGVAEHATFASIPRNVTLNEYIDISKFYCSPKSRQFVNGILDKLTQTQE